MSEMNSGLKTTAPLVATIIETTSVTHKTRCTRG